MPFAAALTVLVRGGLLATALASGLGAQAASFAVSLPGRPFAVAVSSDQQWIFVSVSSPVRNGLPLETRGLIVLRARGRQIKISRTVSLPFDPAGIVLTHDGKLLVVAAQDDLFFFDTGRLTANASSPRLGSLHTGTESGSIYVKVTPDDQTLFVSEEDAGTISVIDLAALRARGFKAASPLAKIPVGHAPVALAFSPDGRWLYATSQRALKEWGWPSMPNKDRPEGAILVVDVARARIAASDSVVARIPAGADPVRLAVSPNGDRLFVTARESNEVLVFDSAKFLTDPAHARLAAIPVGPAPVPIALIDAGQVAFVGNSNRFGAEAGAPSTITILDASKIGPGLNPVVGSIPCGAFPREFCLSPDGQTLYLTNFLSSTLQVIDVSAEPR